MFVCVAIQSASRRRAEEEAERHRKQAADATDLVAKTVSAAEAAKAQLEADLAEARRLAEASAAAAKLRAEEATAATRRAEVRSVHVFLCVCRVRVLVRSQGRIGCLAPTMMCSSGVNLVWPCVGRVVGLVL